MSEVTPLIGSNTLPPKQTFEKEDYSIFVGRRESTHHIDEQHTLTYRWIHTKRGICIDILALITIFFLGLGIGGASDEVIGKYVHTAIMFVMAGIFAFLDFICIISFCRAYGNR